ncbi:DUF4230 domain-containing protein [Corynebacterium faecale]|uniref:DUF4230 domain-containing protein n=1 Tax=Corynebacterium faecale TaxID=1758466 RepID=UPI0025B4BAC8|nr:DUF4230 domain-containing protein [Corynebacterium faecale]
MAIGVTVSVTLMFVNDDDDSAFDSSRDSQVISALELKNEVSLISASTQGVHEVENFGTIFGDRRRWGSTKSALIEYSYKSKLGFEGEEVNINPTRDNRYEIVIPEFKLIGHEDIAMRTVDERTGWLSFNTDDIDAGAVVTQIMTEQKIEELIDGNRELLELQAEKFYRGLLLEVDHDVELDFKFQGARSV